MSDFLNNLAVIAQGKGQVIRPRLASRFESLRQTAGAADLETDALEEAAPEMPVPLVVPQSPQEPLAPLSEPVPGPDTIEERVEGNVASAVDHAPAQSQPAILPPREEAQPAGPEQTHLEVESEPLPAQQDTGLRHRTGQGRERREPEMARPSSSGGGTDEGADYTTVRPVQHQPVTDVPRQSRRASDAQDDDVPLFRAATPAAVHPPRSQIHPGETETSTVSQRQAPASSDASEPWIKANGPVRPRRQTPRQEAVRATPSGDDTLQEIQEKRPASRSAPQRDMAMRASASEERHSLQANLLQHPSEPVAGDRQRKGSSTTIRVTIGRVEVRASVPPTPQTHVRPARRKPTVSLDEYLRRRNGGRP